MRFADKPSSFGELVTAGYSAFSSLFPKILPVILLMLLAVIVFVGISAGIAALGGYLFPTASGLALIAGVILGIAWLIIFMLLIAYFYSAMLNRGYAVLSQDETWLKQTWAHAKRTAPRFLGAVCLLNLITVLIYGLGFGLMMLMMMTTGSPGLISVGLVIILGLLLLYLFFRWIMIFPLVAVREGHVFASFKNSFALTKGHWWRIFGVFSLVVGIPSIALSVAGLLLQTYPGTLTMILYVIINIVNYLVVPVLGVGATLVLFNDLELRAKMPTA